MRVELSTELPVDATKAWREVQKPELLEYVTRPILRFRFLSPPGARWQPGRHSAQIGLLGIIPLGRQTIGVEFPSRESDTYLLRDNGSGSVARVWDHLILIEPLGPGRCLYTDRLQVSAGVLTPFVAAFAWLLYAHRQRRWRLLASRGFDYNA